jgi:hypothetical protein
LNNPKVDVIFGLHLGAKLEVGKITYRPAATLAGTGDFKANGTVAMTGSLNMGSNKLINLADPTLAQDGATKAYVDNKTSALSNGALKLVDNNQTDGNKYELKIDNNQLEFRRGANTDDLYLKLYGSTTDSSDGVV